MRDGAAQSARLVVGIETSCDDTSVAFVGDGRVESALVSQTQIEPHLGYGGVVPEAAARIHAEVIDAVFAKALRQAGVGLDTVDGVAVTYGPGLPGALLVGLRFAQGLAFAIQRPLIPVNHLEGHFAAPWLSVDPPPEFPIVALVVSGGHTELLHAAAPGAYRLLGRTRDDAAGEAFDKVARLLGLSFPGGPPIEQAALQAASTPFHLPRAALPGTHDFSFSGLKTAVRRLVEDRLGPNEARQIVGARAASAPDLADDTFVAQVARAFQESVVDVLVAKTLAAQRAHGAASIIVTGGVAANRRLRAAMTAASTVPVHFPALRHCADNASMIAVAGAWRLARGEVGDASLDLDIEPGLRLA